jgi:hypothetical protein
VQIPNFPECNHELVTSLSQLSDRDLLQAFRQQPESGRYFTALFCRYSTLVFTLIRHSAKSPVQADYLFALTWRHVLHELNGLELTADGKDPEGKPFSLQSWLINLTALCINQAELPEAESIHYALQEAPPPLWCYVERSLDQISAVERLMVVMAQTFRWSDTRIAAYLQAEGESMTPAQVRQQLQVAYQNLEAALPEDIRAIYLGYLPQAMASQPIPEGDPLGTLEPDTQVDRPDAPGSGLAAGLTQLLQPSGLNGFPAPS